MSSVGSLAGGMAHEINNPLAGILQSAQNIRRRLTPGLHANLRAAKNAGCDMEALQAYLESRDILTFLDAIVLSGARAAAIVRNMLGFIRQSPSAHSSASLTTIVDRALDLASADYDLRKKFDFKRIQIVRDYAKGLPDVMCASMEIEQVIFNMLINAAHALNAEKLLGSPPKIVVRVFQEGPWVVTQIEDNGPGMEEHVRKKVFEPFFSTKETGKGTGLGLSVSYFIITRNHGGAVHVDSLSGKGTTFSIRLPIRPAPNEKTRVKP